MLRLRDNTPLLLAGCYWLKALRGSVTCALSWLSQLGVTCLIVLSFAGLLWTFLGPCRPDRVSTGNRDGAAASQARDHPE